LSILLYLLYNIMIFKESHFLHKTWCVQHFITGTVLTVGEF